MLNVIPNRHMKPTLFLSLSPAVSVFSFSRDILRTYQVYTQQNGQARLSVKKTLRPLNVTTLLSKAYHMPALNIEPPLNIEPQCSMRAHDIRVVIHVIHTRNTKTGACMCRIPRDRNDPHKIRSKGPNLQSYAYYLVQKYIHSSVAVLLNGTFFLSILLDFSNGTLLLLCASLWSTLAYDQRYAQTWGTRTENQYEYAYSFAVVLPRPA